ncbi:MAG: YXWGXW repeat-containing protein [Betaproteobacteria bacterium]|nr:YXWGXW repeat-containing protein [Betaproteobacteria bacterium]
MKRISVLIAAGLTAFATLPTAARPNVDVFLNFGPPALRYEPVPSPRVGFIWTPGYWDWRGNSYVWIGGSYVQERPGHNWYAPQWVRGDRGWYHQPGRWERVHYHGRDYRDSDRDGIPNYRDPNPYGRPYAYHDPGRHHGHRHGRRGIDSDRDGIPNHRDPYPYDRDNDGRPDRWDRRPYDPRR